MARRAVLAALVAVVLLLVAWAVQRVLFQPSAKTDSKTLPAQPAPPPARIAVSHIEGTVERGGGTAPWTALKDGDALALDESIRTGEDGRAVLDVGDAARVQVEPASQFSVRELTREAARVRLDGGRMSATVREGMGASLAVENRGSDAVATSEGGELSVVNTGHGEVLVAARRGRVRLSAAGGSVDVGAGEQSSVHSETAPSAPSAIPASLFLKVVGLDKRMQRETSTTVHGNASPGAIINVNGIRAVSESDGTFAAVVELKEGRNAIVVQAEDVLGRRERVDAGQVTVKSKMAPVESKADWGRTTKGKGTVVW
jgi:hypothetical protein